MGEQSHSNVPCVEEGGGRVVGVGGSRARGCGWHANWRQRRVVRELLKNVQHASVSFFVPPRIYSYF